MADTETRRGIGVSPGTAYGPVVQVAPPVRPPAGEPPAADPLLSAISSPSQRVTTKYFWLTAVLFLVQILLGSRSVLSSSRSTLRLGRQRRMTPRSRSSRPPP